MIMALSGKKELCTSGAATIYGFMLFYRGIYEDEV